MKYLQNLHTHTIFCDGKDTPEEMILAALEKGFDSLGFSGHSYMDFSQDFSMSLAGTEQYKQEISVLKEKYAGQIEIYCGMEVELFSEVELTGYDYLIGSAHYFKIDGAYIGFDRDAVGAKSAIDTYFDGDGLRYAKAYYEMLATLPQHGDFDILGHFDLITKHSEKFDFFDPEAPQYLQYAFDAIEALRGKVPLFEVNTGAIARGYRTTPYPSIPILKRLLECGFLPVISSDCHDRNKLDCAFDDCVELLETCGVKDRYVLTAGGFQPVGLR